MIVSKSNYYILFWISHVQSHPKRGEFVQQAELIYSRREQLYFCLVTDHSASFSFNANSTVAAPELLCEISAGALFIFLSVSLEAYRFRFDFDGSDALTLPTMFPSSCFSYNKEGGLFIPVYAAADLITRCCCSSATGETQPAETWRAERWCNVFLWPAALLLMIGTPQTGSGMCAAIRSW